MHRLQHSDATLARKYNRRVRHEHTDAHTRTLLSLVLAPYLAAQKLSNAGPEHLATIAAARKRRGPTAFCLKLPPLARDRMLCLPQQNRCTVSKLTGKIPELQPWCPTCDEGAWGEKKRTQSTNNNKAPTSSHTWCPQYTCPTGTLPGIARLPAMRLANSGVVAAAASRPNSAKADGEAATNTGFLTGVGFTDAKMEPGTCVPCLG